MEAVVPPSFRERLLSSLGRTFGFRKRQNLIYFLTLSTLLTLFVLLRAPSLLIDRIFCSPYQSFTIPGECYHYAPLAHSLPSRRRIGIILHLYSVFPGSLLAITQFIPSLRTKRPQLHRRLGYACWACGFVAIVSALLIFDTSFGGTWSARTAALALGVWGSVGHILAYKGIKEGRVDRHRRWMLRTWCGMGSIVTMRPVLLLMTSAVVGMQKLGWQLGRGWVWWDVLEMGCGQVFYILSQGVEAKGGRDFWGEFEGVCWDGIGKMPEVMKGLGWVSPTSPLLRSGMSPTWGYGVIGQERMARLASGMISKKTEENAAAMDLAAGPALWFVMILHFVLTEWYLKETRDEDQRLKRVSEARIKARKAEQEKKRNLSAKQANGVLQKAKEDDDGLRKEQEALSAKALDGQDEGVAR